MANSNTPLVKSDKRVCLTFIEWHLTGAEFDGMNEALMQSNDMISTIDAGFINHGRSA
jgi:hypothetical protein